MDKPLLFYDVGELGWSLLLSAHINYLSESNVEVTVCTTKDRFLFYNGVNVKLIELPSELKEEFKGLDRDGTHLYNHEQNIRVTNDVVWKYFDEYFGKKYEVLLPKRGYYFGERTFHTYKPSMQARLTIRNMFEGKRVFLIFPRKRKGKFGKRNLSEDFYLELCESLCNDYPMHDIIAIGSSEESYYLYDDIEYENFYDFSLWNDEQTLDLLIAICKDIPVELAIGSQSALPKISLVMGVKTFIIGHEKKRHVEDENWMGANVYFYEAEQKNSQYEVDIVDCIEKIYKFANVTAPIFVNDVEIDRMTKNYRQQYLEEPLLFYDCGEIGWTQHIVAYIKKFKKDSPWRRIAVVTSKAKYVFYRDCCDNLIEIPDDFSKLVEGFEPERHFFIDPEDSKRKIKHSKLKNYFESKFPNCVIFSEYEKFINPNFGRWYYRPYISSLDARRFVKELCGDDKAILIFPRKRPGNFGRRNLPLSFYRKLVPMLKEQFSGLLISIGSREGAYNISNVVNLVKHNDDETLDILVAFCNLKKAIMTIGPQSGVSKIALLCGIPSFMIGHQEERHVKVENWANTAVEFFTISQHDYSQFDQVKCIDEILHFAEICEKW